MVRCLDPGLPWILSRCQQPTLILPFCSLGPQVSSSVKWWFEVLSFWRVGALTCWLFVFNVSAPCPFLPPPRPSQPDSKLSLEGEGRRGGPRARRLLGFLPALLKRSRSGCGRPWLPPHLVTKVPLVPISTPASPALLNPRPALSSPYLRCPADESVCWERLSGDVHVKGGCPPGAVREEEPVQALAL